MTVLDSDAVETPAEETTTSETPGRSRGRVLVHLVAPLLVLAMAVGVGLLKWQVDSVAMSQGAAAQAVVAATEGASAMLSYRADHAREDLTAASERMTGDFRNEYAALINDLVIPGAEQKRISAVASVPAAALISADAERAQVLVYINQTTSVGADAPTDTKSSARVDVEKVGDRWLISGFEPV
jgi:Mce-associated membrane protein